MATGRVTPAGVRDGRQEELEALVELRGPAALAFARQLCTPADAPRAAAEALARFRRAVVDLGETVAPDPDRLLVAAVRHATARFAQPGPVPAGLLGRRHRPTEACAESPGLLAARAGGTLDAGGAERLERHLGSCPMCRDVERRFDDAERAYADPQGTVDPDEAALLLRALVAAAPVTAAPAAGPPTEDPWTEPDPDEGQADDPYEPPTEALAPVPVAPEEPPVIPVRERRRPPRSAAERIGLRVLLPGAVVLAAVLIVVALAGVFGGGEPEPPRATPNDPTQRVEEPVTTPLPVVPLVSEEPEPDPSEPTGPTGPSGASGPTGP